MVTGKIVSMYFSPDSKIIQLGEILCQCFFNRGGGYGVTVRLSQYLLLLISLSFSSNTAIAHLLSYIYIDGHRDGCPVLVI